MIGFPPGFSAELSPDGKSRLLTVHGELDIDTVTALRRVALGAGGSSLTVDLRKLRFIDSKGIGLLHELSRPAHRGQGSMTLLCKEGDVLRMLHLAGIDTVIPIVADPDGAGSANGERRIRRVPRVRLRNRDS